MNKFIKIIRLLVCGLAFSSTSQASFILEEIGKLSYKVVRHINKVSKNSNKPYIFKRNMSTSSAYKKVEIQEIEEKLLKVKNNCAPTLNNLDATLGKHANRITELMEQYKAFKQNRISDIASVYKAMVNTHANFLSHPKLLQKQELNEKQNSSVESIDNMMKLFYYDSDVVKELKHAF